MPDINATEVGLSVFVADGTSSEKASVLTATPSSGDAGLAVREVQRGQGTMATSIPVVIASDQTAINTNHSKTEDAAHTSGDIGSFVLAVRNDSFVSRTSADGDYSPISVDSAGRIGVVDGGLTLSVDDGGTVLSVDDAGGSLTVDGTVAVSSVGGTVTTGDNKAEDAAHVSGDTGSFVLGVRNDAAASLTSADGDYSPVAVDSAGRTLVAQPTASVLNAQVVGNVAHDAVDSGNPVKIGGQARTTNPTAVADADRAQLMTDDVGRLVVVSSHVRDLVTKQFTSLVTTTETTILTAGGAGVFHDLTSLSISSDKNGVVLTVRDSTGGSTVWQGYVDAGRNMHMQFAPPLPQTTANNNWTIQSDSGTAIIRVTVQAVKNV